MQRTLIALIAVTAVTAAGCKTFNSRRPVGNHNLPPAQMLMQPGPGVGGPGPGVMMQGAGGPMAGGPMAGGAMAAGCMMPMGPMGPGAGATTQISFIGPKSTTVTWDLGVAGGFDSEPLVFPGRQNFPQGGIYRLKLTNVEGRPGQEYYPTLEVGPATPRTDAYLAHTPVPVQFTEEDFDQVQSGNFVTKVIYLPDPEFQDLALAGVETLVSTRLDPGVDPITEADRRGSILAIVRIGGKDLELPGGEGIPGDVMPASYQAGGVGGDGMMGPMMPQGMATAAMGPMAGPPNFVAGVTGPQWGMPMSGTPIGLPGPPHVPLGVPAGLKKHVVKNHTKMRIPDPVEKFKINVRQRPGFSYPKPVSKVSITDRVRAPFGLLFNPLSNKRKTVVDQPH